MFSLKHTKFAVLSAGVQILALKVSCVGEQHEKTPIVPALNVCISFSFYEENPIELTTYKEKNSYKLCAKNSTIQ